MMVKSVDGRNRRSQLRREVQSYTEQHNIAVIPTTGKRPHASLSSTSHFWSTRLDADEVQTLFTHDNITGYGVLCGGVSDNLFVLDFDTPTGYASFVVQLPHLETLTVKTPRGYHVYFRAAQPQATRQMSAMKGQLQGERGYVIGPGSTVAGRGYTLFEDCPIRTLNAVELDRVRIVLGLTDPHPQEHLKSLIVDEDKSTERLVKLYQIKAAEGRNNALYACALYARQSGLSLEQTRAVLVQPHIDAPAPQGHVTESDRARYREAIATTYSAFQVDSALARQPTITKVEGLLPNKLREKMMHYTGRINAKGRYVDGSTIPGRAVEILMRSIEPGEVFSATQARKLLMASGMGRKSVYRVLTGTLGNTPSGCGFRIFISATPPPVGDTRSRIINKHYDKPVSPTRGREPTYYVMPSVEELCERYDVTPGISDVLTPRDLLSAKRYRMGMYREYVGRRAPEEPILSHAHRLTVDTSTVYRYIKELDLLVTPVISSVPVTWENVDHPDLYVEEARSDGVTPGYWLEDADTGKRYPLLKGIALRRLAADARLLARRRDPSRQQLRDGPVLMQDVIERRWMLSGEGQNLSRSVVKAFAPPQQSPEIVEDAPSLSILDLSRLGIDSSPLLAIKGLGLSRVQQLYAADIDSLGRLANAEIEQLMEIPWWGQSGKYLSPRIFADWKRQAAELLGWQAPDPERIAREAAREAQRGERRRYRKLFNQVLERAEVARDGCISEPDGDPRRVTYDKLDGLRTLQSREAFYSAYSRQVFVSLARELLHAQRDVLLYLSSLSDGELATADMLDRPLFRRECKQIDRLLQRINNVVDD